MPLKIDSVVIEFDITARGQFSSVESRLFYVFWPCYISSVSTEASGESRDDDFNRALSSLDDAIERNIDRAGRTAEQIDRTLITLAAGGLLLSSTLVPVFAPKKLLLFLLFVAWLLFVASMVLVILAMGSARRAAEKAICDASEDLKKLEEHPNIARDFIEKFKLPITQKRISQNTCVACLNNWALITFIVGVVCFATFAGYNLWRTPTSPSPAETERASPAQPSP
jgi:hypothetical protein